MTRKPGSGASADQPRVVLIGKPGCHLCDTARDVVVSVTSQLGVGWREVSILDDPSLAEQYREQIPVVLVDGEQHDFWRVDERRLRDALEGRRRRWLRR
ncbi:MAG TPA: glutaredoxin family protein [Kineosporiaceae bacterium]|nr:glutaredoxin family protein [Kineosporiaceae bacterium]